MDLLLFTAFLVIALAFFALGKIFKAFFFVAGGGLLLLVLGFASYHPPLSYQVVNQTNTSYSFSPDYFEYSNDTVVCHNCTAFDYNETFGSTPPGCCSHNVNTTITGTVSESRNTYFETRELDYETSGLISLSFALFGLGAILDVGLSMLNRRNRGEEDGGNE